MALTLLTTEAIEEGTYFIDVSFLDEDDEAVTPNADTIFWTLTTPDGTVINDRDNEGETSDTTITIELEGDDLAIQAGENAEIVRRHVSVKWEYDSDLGNDKPGKAGCVFPLRNLSRIPATEP